MDACAIPQPAEPCALVIFGASGDLTKRKLLPSLYNLASYHLMPADFCIIGVARRPLTDDVFRDQLGKDLAELGTQPVDPNLWDRFRGRISYCSGDFDNPVTYKKLTEALANAEKEFKTSGNVVFYLSVQPDYFATICKQLSDAGLLAEGNGRWRRVIIEKPFGHDLTSARLLSTQLTSVLQEHQIYRIDHYLGKETAQNLLVFRIGNAIFEPVWNRRYVDHVQLTVAESIGVEGRGAFYESAGAFRDVMQNHMFMLLALVAMEPPTTLEGEAIRNEKVKLLRSIRRTTPEEALKNTVRGQYGEGMVGGKKVPGYRQEPNVDPESTVETFAAVKLMIENWRWAGVPFYLRSGKRLPKRSTKIVFRFKTPPLSLFASNEADPIAPNYLIFSIQPEEGITLQVRAKIPGPTICTRSVRLEFDYNQFGDRQPTTGYEKLLYDCMVGDASLFHRSDMVEAAWEAAAPILEAWHNSPPTDFPNYAAGTWGPEGATQLLANDGHHWWHAETSS
ncbi:MAG TPA: glucose-6-phosphate dehydrogenase [Chthoniobacterales bacterium]|nr:glucose-6-phosphate dehydrogenase [Chthoniobacterales bacterium]